MVDAGNNPVAIIGVHPTGPEFERTSGLLAGKTKESLQALIPPELVGGQVPIPDGVVAGAGQEAESLLVLARFCLRLFALRDVDGQNNARGSPVIGDGFGGDFDVDDLPAFAPVPPDPKGRGPGLDFIDDLLQALDVFRGTDVPDRHLEELGLAVSVVIDGPLIDREEAEGLQIVDPHRHRAALEEQAVMLIAPAQGFLGLLLGGDILENAIEALEDAVLHLDRAGGADPAPLPLGRDKFQFKVVGLSQGESGFQALSRRGGIEAERRFQVGQIIVRDLVDAANFRPPDEMRAGKFQRPRAKAGHLAGKIHQMGMLRHGGLRLFPVRDVDVHDHRALAAALRQGGNHEAEPTVFLQTGTGVFERVVLRLAT